MWTRWGTVVKALRKCICWTYPAGKKQVLEPSRRVMPKVQAVLSEGLRKVLPKSGREVKTGWRWSRPTKRSIYQLHKSHKSPKRVDVLSNISYVPFRRYRRYSGAKIVRSSRRTILGIEAGVILWIRKCPARSIPSFIRFKSDLHDQQSRSTIKMGKFCQLACSLLGS